MRWLDPLLERPLPVFLGAAFISLLGLWCVSKLPVTRTPHVDIPYSVVVSTYEGASPEDVESEVTIKIEEQLSALEDLRHQWSISSEGVSTHILEFEDRTEMDDALRDVREKADLARVDLPKDSDDPIVKGLSFETLPILLFTVSGRDDPYLLREIAEDLEPEPELEAIDGVSSVDVFGGYEREVEVFVDPPALDSYGLSLADVASAVARQGHSTPAGRLRSSRTDRLIRTTGEFRNLEEIRNVVVGTDGGHAVELRDVGKVRRHHERETSGSWFMGEPSVTLIVRRRENVNTLETSRRLEARVEELRSGLPPGIRIDTTSSAADLIRLMLRQLGTSMGVGLVLVVALLFVTLGLRQALLVSFVLPFSLLFTFIGLYVLGMSISNTSLFGLILVLGLVVDGAIIVAEAIHREREEGADAREAAKRGLARVGLPVISADLTTIAAFVPMLLMVGVMGQFMAVVPKVVIFALTGSILVDHLFLPTAASQMRRSGRGRAPARLERLHTAYLRALDLALHHRVAVLGVTAVLVATAPLAYVTGAVRSIFLPYVDRGRFSIDFSMPLGTSLEETNRVGQLIEQAISRIPEAERWVLTTGDTGALDVDTREGGRVGPEYGRLTVELEPRSARRRSQPEIIAALRRELDGYAGVDFDVQEVQEGPPVGSALLVRVQGKHLSEIAPIAAEVKRRIRDLPGAEDVRTDYDRSKPEVRVAIDRSRAAAAYGITPAQISQTLRTAFYGVQVGEMWVQDERVDVRLRAIDGYDHDVDHVRELGVRSRTGEIVPIGDMAQVGLDFSPDAIHRFDGRRTISVRADAAPDASSVDLFQAGQRALADLALPPGVRLQFGGETEERGRSYASLWSALKWGLVLIYLIMAVQFDSIWQPLVVLFTIPLSIVGVTAGLLATGTPFSFMVFIGVVSLTGIVVNDGIVLVDGINQELRAGRPFESAVREASLRRLRPVLLTTATTIFGLLPLTLNIATGGEFWVPLGVAIISGLLVASLLTLLFVPVLFSVLAGLRRPPAPTAEVRPLRRPA